MAEDPLFEPVRVGPLQLRNRFVRAAAFEGLCPGGAPTPELIAFHEALARGGVALTTVAYASVSAEGRAYPHQLALRAAGTPEGLGELARAVHARRAAVALQLAHAGAAADPATTGAPAIGPSPRWNLYTLHRTRAMTGADMQRVAAEFAEAARVAAAAGFDAVEIHAAHGYLLSQFLSPWTNRRRDDYGGALENRLRFPVEVVSRVREAVGGRLAVIVKMNASDGFRGGLTPREAVDVARGFAAAGADALIVSGGFMLRTPLHVMRGDLPIAELARAMPSRPKRILARCFGRWTIPAAPFREAYFLEQARPIRQAVRIPVGLVGGLRTRSTMERVVREGFDLLVLARPLIAEPDLVARLRERTAEAARCVPCNRCLAAVAAGPVRCPTVRDT